MHVLPPINNPVSARPDSRWLPPLRFRLRAYLQLSQDLDGALAELEARYPKRLPLLTLEGRAQRLAKKRKPK
jgi:hypothetical protein